MRRESDGDRATEDAVAQQLAMKWRCEFIRTRDAARVDTLFMRNKALVAVAEIKARLNREFATYPTVHLNLQKWFSLVQFEIAAEVPAFMVYAFSDGIYYLRASTLPIGDCKMAVRGREDRAGVDERQPVIEIATAQWKRLAVPSEVAA